MQLFAFLTNRSTQKRCLDVALATTILLVGAIPLAFAVVLVRLSSGKPVLYRQVRVGRHGMPFVIYKLRTMRPSMGGPSVTVAGSARITREGRFLRATKMDELPQLFNVLKGDMSLVGPRPEVPEYVEKYSEQDKLTVLSARPGLTDLASIRFRSESSLLASKAEPLVYYEKVIIPIKLRYYRFYVRRAGPLLDLYIMTLTASALLKDLGALLSQREGAPPRAHPQTAATWSHAQPLTTIRRRRRRMHSLAG